MWTQLLLSAVVLVSSARAESLPPYIKKCNFDSKINECIMKSSSEAIKGLVKGYPKLGIPVLDPLLIGKIQHTSSGSRSISLNFTLSNVKLIGLKNSKLVKSEFDPEKHIVKFSAEVPQLKFDADYALNGKFLILPVVGNGQFKSTIDNLFFTIMVKYDVVKKKGEEYFSLILPPKLTYTTTKVALDFTNLFNGDKNLGDNFNKLVNENWKEWDAIIGPVLGDALGEAIGSVLKKALDVVPSRELIP